MSREAVKEFIKSRPSIFWWTLLNALAAAFAIASWSICLYLFKFPERPFNYDVLRWVKRLAPVASYTPLESPDGLSAEPRELLKTFYSLPDDQFAAHNRYFKRNYITNFKEPEAVSYIEGIYRVTRVRGLTPDDLFHPGLAIRAEAIVVTDELNEPTAYPVVLEILLPFSKPPADTTYPEGHIFEFRKLDHRLLVLHAARIGSANQPAICLTVVPLAFDNFTRPDKSPLPLAPPDPLNLEAPFPVMEEHRSE